MLCSGLFAWEHMDDLNLTASTEQSAPTDSGAEAPIAAASDVGAGMDTSGSPSDAVTSAPATEDASIDAGWSWEDEGEEPASSDAENPDGDIEALTQDPALDQAKVPGLVQALRSARQAERERAKELKGIQETLAKFEDYGGIEGATEALGLVNRLIAGGQEGTTEFLQGLYDAAQPAYVQLVTDAIRYNPDYAIKQLQAMGKLPAELATNAGAPVDDDTLSAIPEHLRETAKAMPPQVLQDLLLQTDDVRDFHLERQRRLNELEAGQREAAEKGWQQQWQTATQEGQKLVEQISTQYEQAHYAQLAKWQPYGPGPENETKNQQVYGEIVEGAMSQILGDPKFAQLYRDAAQLMANAPLRRLQGEKLAAQQDEQRARGMAAQFNTRLGQILRERVKERNEVYKGYRAYMEMQRGAAPQRREIAGSTMINSNGTSALGPDGKASPAFLESLAAQINFGS